MRRVTGSLAPTQDQCLTDSDRKSTLVYLSWKGPEGPLWVGYNNPTPQVNVQYAHRAKGKVHGKRDGDYHDSMAYVKTTVTGAASAS